VRLFAWPALRWIMVREASVVPSEAGAGSCPSVDAGCGRGPTGKPGSHPPLVRIIDSHISFSRLTIGLRSLTQERKGAGQSSSRMVLTWP
jgi:hypothetical protein